MNRLLSLILVSSLLLSLGLVISRSIPSVRASPDLYQGDLVLDGNNVTTIQGPFDINGSIIVRGNATLILENAVVNFTQTSKWQWNMTFEDPLDGNPRLLAANTTVTSSYLYSIRLDTGSSATVFDTEFGGYSGGHCQLWVIDSAYFDQLTVFGMSISGSSANVFISSSFISVLNVYSVANLSVYNTTVSMGVNTYGTDSIFLDNCTLNVANADSESQQYISNSTITYVWSYENATIWLVNSTYTNHAAYNWSTIFVFWNLDVHVVDLSIQDVPYANVTATYPNVTLAESELTSSDGWARLTLMEKMMNETGDYPVGNYTVAAEFEAHEEQQSVNMTNTREITIQLQFIIPEFPSSLLLPLFITATLLAVSIYSARHTHKVKLHTNQD